MSDIRYKQVLFLRFPCPSKLNFNNMLDAIHIAVFGAHGSGVSTITKQVPSLALLFVR